MMIWKVENPKKNKTILTSVLHGSFKFPLYCVIRFSFYLRYVCLFVSLKLIAT